MWRQTQYNELTLWTKPLSIEAVRRNFRIVLPVGYSDGAIDNLAYSLDIYAQDKVPKSFHLMERGYAHNEEVDYVISRMALGEHELHSEHFSSVRARNPGDDFSNFLYLVEDNITDHPIEIKSRPYSFFGKKKSGSMTDALYTLAMRHRLYAGGLGNVISADAQTLLKK